MKLKPAIIAFALVSILTSCQKDWAEDWVGTYTGTTGGSSNINRVVVSKVDNKTLKMELQVPFGLTFATFATVGSAKLSNATTAKVNEDGTIVGDPEAYHFSGNVTRNGSTITFYNAQAQSKTNPGNIKYYSFTGSR